MVVGSRSQTGKFSTKTQSNSIFYNLYEAGVQVQIDNTRIQNTV